MTPRTGVTQWADTAAQASTWDTGVAGEYGQAYGAEQAGKGHNVALGPTINILRLPTGVVRRRRSARTRT